LRSRWRREKVCRQGVPAGGMAHVRGQGGERRASRSRASSPKGEIAAASWRRVGLPPPRDEDEIRGGGRLIHEAHAVVVDQQPVIDALADLDAAAGVGAPVRAARDLDQARAEVDSVVPGDPAGVAAAEAIGEVAGRSLPDRRGLRGGLGKSAAVGSQVGGQEGLGRREGVDLAEAELGDEAILQGGPPAFDAALRLGRVGGDVSDAKIPEDLAEVGRMLRALQFLLERPVRVVPHEDAEAIPGEGHGQPVPCGEAAQQGEIAVQVFGGAEVEGHDGARRVVDGTRVPVPSQSNSLPSTSTRAPRRARRGRRARCGGGRRRRLGGRPRVRRTRRTVLRLTARPSSSRSVSVAWQSLKSR
jgi:hypothetical protein